MMGFGGAMGSTWGMGTGGVLLLVLIVLLIVASIKYLVK